MPESAQFRVVKALQHRVDELVGEILGSNWQAGSNLSHYYNLWSDAQVGILDRHNYFGGANTFAPIQATFFY